MISCKCISAAHIYSFIMGLGAANLNARAGFGRVFPSMTPSPTRSFLSVTIFTKPARKPLLCMRMNGSPERGGGTEHKWQVLKKPRPFGGELVRRAW